MGVGVGIWVGVGAGTDGVGESELIMLQPVRSRMTMAIRTLPRPPGNVHLRFLNWPVPCVRYFMRRHDTALPEICQSVNASHFFLDPDGVVSPERTKRAGGVLRLVTRDRRVVIPIGRLI